MGQKNFKGLCRTTSITIRRMTCLIYLVTACLVNDPKNRLSSVNLLKNPFSKHAQIRQLIMLKEAFLMVSPKKKKAQERLYIAGKNLANPCALLLSAVSMLRHLGIDYKPTGYKMRSRNTFVGTPCWSQQSEELKAEMDSNS
ncbi:hypothetical protein Hdeb2414_s0011g00360021 [Helianthus debilis subsp. tardiflorus]